MNGLLLGQWSSREAVPRRNNGMKLKDEVVIDATSDKVWEYVGSPEMWPLFHVKAGECRQIRHQSDVIGSLYDIEFRLGSKTSITRCEIVDRRIGRLISIRSTLPEPDGQSGRSLSAGITYELEDQGWTTRVKEQIEFTSINIPPILRPLIWLISRFGRPTGETTLMRLKRMVEEEG
jgi:uncharacterized protein YndB with AHSA1/START domain